MTRESEQALLRALPKKKSVEGELYLHSIEAEVLSLQAELSGANLGKAKAVRAQLAGLAGMLGRIGHKSGQLQGMISAAIAKAQRQIEEMEADESKTVSVDVQAKFDSAVYYYMSPEAREFYNRIHEQKHYTLAPISDDGLVMHHAAKTVDAETLARFLSLIKFHSLDTDHKKQVLYQTFGAEEAEGEGTPQDVVMLEKKKQELQALHDALDEMEAYKALIIMRTNKPEVAIAKIRHNHEVIERAHDQIDEVTRKYDMLIKNINDGMAMATLKAAKLKMKEMLKNDVIDHVLLEQKTAQAAISGGVSVAAIAASSTHMGFFASAPWFLRPSA